MGTIEPPPDLLLRSICLLTQQIASLDEKVTRIYQMVMEQRIEKEWYTTAELPEALGKSQYTISERYCNDGRISCEKEPDSGKWRIPGHEFGRRRRVEAEAEVGSASPRLSGFARPQGRCSGTNRSFPRCWG